MTPSKEVRRYLSLVRRSIENDFVLDAWRCRLKANEGISTKFTKRYYRSMIIQFVNRHQRLNKELWKFKVSLRFAEEVRSAFGLQCMLMRLYSPYAFDNKSGLWTINAIMSGKL